MHVQLRKGVNEETNVDIMLKTKIMLTSITSYEWR